MVDCPRTTIYTDHRIVVCKLSFRPRVTNNTSSRYAPPIDIRALDQLTVCDTFQADISNTLGRTDPQLLSSDELSNTIHAAPISAAEHTLPLKTKGQFPDEFSATTIDLIRQKRKL